MKPKLRSYEVHIMLHMLGGKDRLGRPRCCRNFFCAGEETPDWEILENLRGMGYVTKTKWTVESHGAETLIVYRVTPEGLAVLKEVTRKKAQTDAEQN